MMKKSPSLKSSIGHTYFLRREPTASVIVKDEQSGEVCFGSVWLEKGTFAAFYEHYEDECEKCELEKE